MNKQFVQETIKESMMLDHALVSLEGKVDDQKTIVLLHYASVAETIVGEPEQIFPFLGSSKLADFLDSRKVKAASMVMPIWDS